MSDMSQQHFQWRKEYSLPLSALQHYAYCPRQFALIHIEEIFEENVFTVEGNIVHERVDKARNYRGRNKCENRVPVWSDSLGLYGIVDILEYADNNIYPVEYKRGKKKKKLADEVQLGAQCLCLEEMHDRDIPYAYIYYHSSNRRRKVVINDKLKDRVKIIVSEARKHIEKRKVPPAEYSSACDNCSLRDLCLPQARERALNYFASLGR